VKDYLRFLRASDFSCPQAENRQKPKLKKQCWKIGRPSGEK